MNLYTPSRKPPPDANDWGRRHSRATFLGRAVLGLLGTITAVGGASSAEPTAGAVPSSRWKGKRNSKVKRWDIITIGNLSRNRYWGEGDAQGVRSAICTCTVIQGEGFRLIVDPSLAAAEHMIAELDRRTGLKQRDINTVFVTHEHGDHWFGLAHFFGARWLAAPDVAAALNQTSVDFDLSMKSMDQIAALTDIVVPGHDNVFLNLTNPL